METHTPLIRHFINGIDPKRTFNTLFDHLVGGS